MWLLGVVVRRYIDFLILLILTPLVSVLFCSSIPTFCSYFKCFSFLFQCFFVITFYVLHNFCSQYKHTYGQLRVSHGSHMKAAHNVLYMKKHTQTYASYPAMDISCISGCRSRSKGCALYRDASQASRLRTGPASLDGQRSRTRRRGQCMPRRLRLRVPRLPRARYRVMAL